MGTSRLKFGRNSNVGKVSFQQMGESDEDDEEADFPLKARKNRPSLFGRKKSVSPASSPAADTITRTKITPSGSAAPPAERGVMHGSEHPLEAPIRRTSNGSASQMYNNNDDEDDDPVMVLFQSRQKQRVRFSLDGEPKERRVAETRDATENNDGNVPVEQILSSVAADNSENENSNSNTNTSVFNVSTFMKGALFTQQKPDDFDHELHREMEASRDEMDWSIMDEHPATTPLPDRNAAQFCSESEEVKARTMKLLNKARRAQYLHFRYRYAVKCCVRALAVLREARYPDDHALTRKTLQALHNAHFAESAYRNSANIVKLGIKYEDTGDLVRALKMYTIAYRIRRDNLSGGTHPSLVVVLNMLGSIQIKRGELEEAMAIYELALKDTASPPVTLQPGSTSEDSAENSNAANFPPNYLTRAVTYREMGTIHEKRGQPEEALRMYHKSLVCMAEYKGVSFVQEQQQLQPAEQSFAESLIGEETGLLAGFEQDVSTEVSEDGQEGGMELTFGNRGKKLLSSASQKSKYDVFFPPEEEKKRKKRPNGKKNNTEAEPEKRGDHTDVDVSITLHRIAQLHRSRDEHKLALQAFHVSLRGMKLALGKSHPNVAAVLGNIGNLQKEMGDMDSAYSTYQQVLAIESYRLGLSHPDVVVTLHNIATIDAARGNHEHALSLYTQVVNLQRKLFGAEHESVAVTSACMGDVYERLGDTKKAMETYEESLRIKVASLGRHSLEVARLLHKLGKLAISGEDYHLSHSYIAKASLIYKLNKLTDDDEWIVDLRRDAANVDAAIAMGRGADFFEC